MDGAVAERIRREVTRAEGFRWMASMLAEDPERRRWRLLQHNGQLWGVPVAHDGLEYARPWLTEGASGDGWVPALPALEPDHGLTGGQTLAAARSWSLVVDDPGSIGCLLQLVATTRPGGAYMVANRIIGGADWPDRHTGPDVAALGYALALLLLGWPS